MEGRVKSALHALSAMYESNDSWLRLSRGGVPGLDRNKCLRMALLRKTQGVVFHDRILTGRDIGG